MDERYMEKPRANLYNVITKLKERHGPSPSRILTIAKINDKKNKDELEKEFTDYFQNFVDEFEMTGLCLIVNQYVLHLMEAERDKLKHIIEAYNAEIENPDSVYHWA